MTCSQVNKARIFIPPFLALGKQFLFVLFCLRQCIDVYVARASLSLAEILLPQPPKHWDYKCVPTHLASQWLSHCRPILRLGWSLHSCTMSCAHGISHTAGSLAHWK